MTILEAVKNYQSLHVDEAQTPEGLYAVHVAFTTKEEAEEFRTSVMGETAALQVQTAEQSAAQAQG